MARSKTGALEALKKLQAARSRFDAEETRLRERAAGELGRVMLDCGAETFEPKLLKALLVKCAELGPEVALARLAKAA